MDAFSPRQTRVVLIGWVTYAAYYLGRVNLASALPAMERSFGWSPEQTSVLAGAMLWTYAAGQLFNGWLGDRVAAKQIVFLGLLGSTLVNLLMAAVTSYELLVMFALINGFLQAMGWGPILRTLSDTLVDSQRRRIAGWFGASYIIGNTLTWVLCGLLLAQGRWQILFIIPPLLMLLVGIGWYRLTPGSELPRHLTPKTRPPLPRINLRDFGVYLFTAIIAGALLNGMLLYAPAYIAQTSPLDQATVGAVVFPIFGLVGTIGLSSAVLRRNRGHETRGMMILLGLAAAARGLALLLPPSTATSILLLSVMGITSYALTNLLLTAVPLLYAHLGTSQVAGVMDATHSIGGAVGSTFVGVLLAQGGWSLVFTAWLILPLVAIALIAVGSHRIKVSQT